MPLVKSIEARLGSHAACRTLSGKFKEKVSLGWLWALGLLQVLCMDALSAQVIAGYVLEAETGVPLPYAHVQVVSPSGHGTITNFKGQFQLTPQENWPQPLAVRISSIGHVTRSATLTGQKVDTIYLAQDKDQLQEITIVANDFERQLMRRVIAKIPENHPVWKEFLTGVVTEKGYLDSLQTIPLYEATAIIRADKESYEKRQDLSNVAVKDGQLRTFPAYNQTRIRIIAGPHNVHRFDVVQLRFGPLRANALNTYNFTRLPETTFDGEPILPLKFENKDYQGTVYINLRDTAVHEMQVTYLNPSKFYTTSSTRTYLRFKVGYSKFDGRYRLRFINYSTGFIDADVFYLENTFAIQSFGETKIPIPVADRVYFNDKLIDLVPQKIERDDLQPLATSPEERFYSRISIDYGYAALLYERNSFSYAFQQRNLEQVTGTVAAARGWRHLPIFQFNYRITNHWQAHYTLTGNGESFSYQGLGVSYRQPLGFSGRWVAAAGVATGSFYNTTPLLEIAGSQLPDLLAGEDPNAKVAIEQKESQWHLTPHLAISYRIWKNWNVKLSGSWINSWQFRSEQLYNYPTKWYQFFEEPTSQNIAASKNYTLPVMLQLQLIFRGY